MMSKLSLLDKLKVLGDVTSSSSLLIVAMVILIALTILLISTKKKPKKISKFMCIAIYGAIIIVSLIFYKEELFSLYDYMMNNFFIAIYFPNLAIYFAAIITTNIILWISIFNSKITKWIRTINTIMFSIIHYLLILIINIITKDKLDIYNQVSVYQNKNAQALIELSSTIFIIWILFLIIYKIIRIYQRKGEVEELPKQEEIKEEMKPRVIKEIVEKKKLPDNIIKTTPPTIIYGKRKEQKQPSIVDFMKNERIEDTNYLSEIPNPTLKGEEQILDTLLNNSIRTREEKVTKPRKVSKIKFIKVPELVRKTTNKETKVIPKKESKITILTNPEKVTKINKKISPRKEENKLDIFDNLLTVEDYKRVLSILKSYKKEEKQQITLEELKNLYQPRK